MLSRHEAGLPHRLIERAYDCLHFVDAEILGVELLPPFVMRQKGKHLFSNCPQAPPEMLATSTTPTNRSRSVAVSPSRSDLLSASEPSRLKMIRIFMRPPPRRSQIAAANDLWARTRPSRDQRNGKRAVSRDRSR